LSGNLIRSFRFAIEEVPLQINFQLLKEEVRFKVTEVSPDGAKTVLGE
jgi:hypothetical protein